MCALPQMNYSMTEAEYLAFERENEFKHEYVDGEVNAMAGASAAHLAINTNLIRMMNPQTNGIPCEVYVPDMRVKVLETANYFYPDMTIVCGDHNYAPGSSVATVLNPIVIMEILSESTELYDQTTKFFQYQRIPSLQDYALVSQKAPRIERYSRQKNGGWFYIEAVGLESAIEVPSIECTLELSTVFRNVNFPEVEDDTQ